MVSTVTAAGSVVIASGPGQQVQLELTSALTTGLASGDGTLGYAFDLVATKGLDRATLIQGVMTVTSNVTP